MMVLIILDDIQYILNDPLGFLLHTKSSENHRETKPDIYRKRSAEVPPAYDNRHSIVLQVPQRMEERTNKGGKRWNHQKKSY